MKCNFLNKIKSKVNNATKQTVNTKQTEEFIPLKYEDIELIAKSIVNGNNVQINLVSTTTDTRRRIMDFISGMIYSLNLVIKQINQDTYLITNNKQSN